MIVALVYVLAFLVFCLFISLSISIFHDDSCVSLRVVVCINLCMICSGSLEILLNEPISGIPWPTSELMSMCERMVPADSPLTRFMYHWFCQLNAVMQQPIVFAATFIVRTSLQLAFGTDATKYFGFMYVSEQVDCNVWFGFLSGYAVSAPEYRCTLYLKCILNLFKK